MLKKSFVLLSASLLMFSGSLLAATLDSGTISEIHTKVKDTIKSKCMTEMDGGTNAVCDCLGDKAQGGLDDSALTKCDNSETGNACIVDAVKKATIQALAPDNIATCRKADGPVATTTTTTTIEQPAIKKTTTVTTTPVTDKTQDVPVPSKAEDPLAD